MLSIEMSCHLTTSANQDERHLKALVVDPSTSIRKEIMKTIHNKLGILPEGSEGANEHVFNKVRKSMIEVKNGKFCDGYCMVLLSHILKGDSTGSQTARHLRQLGYDGLIIVVFEDLAIDEAVHFREYGVDATICKPVTAEKLVQTLQGENKNTKRNWYLFMNPVLVRAPISCTLFCKKLNLGIEFFFILNHYNFRVDD